MNTLPAPWNTLVDGSATHAQLERLSLSVRRTREECWLDYQYSNLNDTAASAEPQSLRFLLSDSKPSVRISPLLADRTVVVRPIMPTELPPKQHATLFISTVLWARVTVGEQTLAELPSVRLSDTWFGANTRHGELCYASQTRALLNLDNVQYSPLRAITPITINNQGEDNVRLERINVPVPYLTLYCDGKRFWTSGVNILREKNLATANVQIEASARQDAFLVAPPRRPVRGGVLDRAVDLLFA
jgi:hypothetical protein